MWWLLPAVVTLSAFSAAGWPSGEPSRSEWGSLLVSLGRIAMLGVAVIVSLAAWLVYFIVN